MTNYLLEGIGCNNCKVLYVPTEEPDRYGWIKDKCWNCNTPFAVKVRGSY